jgi:hypothetical protein
MFLVPKLHLGMRLPPKLSFRQTPPMRSRYHVHEHDAEWKSIIARDVPIFALVAGL